MLRDVVDLLRCPLCEADVVMGDGTLSCPTGHSFDIARQGYVNLLPGDARPATADTREMVAARAAFLASDHFSAIAEAVASACGRLAGDGPVADLGAGTGYYLAHALERLPGRSGIALDLSKHAARRAARAHPRIGAAVCDVWRPLPMRTGATGAVLSIFSPRNGPEMRRVLRDDGVLVAVTPADEHLAELVEAAGMLTVDSRKENRLDERLGGSFRLQRRSSVSVVMSLGHADLERLVQMGPSARHVDPAATRARIAAMPTPAAVTASVKVLVYRPR